MGLQLAGANLTLPLKTPAIGERLGPSYVWRYDRFWPKADPENWSFAVVKASALEKSGH